MELNLSKIIKEIYKTHKFKIIALGIVIVLIICLVFYGGQIHKAKEETRKGLVENSNSQVQKQNTYNKKSEDKNLKEPAGDTLEGDIAVYDKEEAYKLKEGIELNKGDKVEIIKEGFVEVKIKYKDNIYTIDGNDFIEKFDKKEE